MIVPIAVQDALRIALGIVVLIGPQREEKKQQARAAQYQGNRDQIGQNIHIAYRSRNALSDTVIELAYMAKAATNGVARPSTAIGTAITL